MNCVWIFLFIEKHVQYTDTHRDKARTKQIENANTRFLYSPLGNTIVIYAIYYVIIFALILRE